MNTAESRDEVSLLRWRLECCFAQGRTQEAIRLGRRLDELQCQLLRKTMELKKVAG